MNRTQFWKIAVLCLVSALGNAIVSHFFNNILAVPLYLDTVFNAAMCFCAGLLPGLVTGVVLSPIMYFLVCKYFLGLSVELGLFRNVWVICIAVEILLICAFHIRMKKRETSFLANPSLQTFIGVAPPLMALAVLDCLIVSVSGGIIDFVLTTFQVPRTFSPEDSFKLGLLRNNVPLLPTAILSRIPINIVDRFIAIFGGFGISLLYRKWLRAQKVGNGE
jgi:hypothetical protein